MFSMPLPGLPPTVISAPEPGPASGGGRRQATLQKLIASGRQLIRSGQTQLSVEQLASAAEVSVVTVRAHWQGLAAALELEAATEATHTPGNRTYQRAILCVLSTPTIAAACDKSIDQANNKDLITSLIYAHAAPGRDYVTIDMGGDGALSVVEEHDQLLAWGRPVAVGGDGLAQIDCGEGSAAPGEPLALTPEARAGVADHARPLSGACGAVQPAPSAPCGDGVARVAPYGVAQTSAALVCATGAMVLDVTGARDHGARRADHADRAGLSAFPLAPPGGAEQTPPLRPCVAVQANPTVMDDAGRCLHRSRAPTRTVRLHPRGRPRAALDPQWRYVPRQPP